MNDWKALVELLKLQPHPEGGFYRETYRAEGKSGRHNHSTAIYYLLPAGQRSLLHRMKSDEVFHFYLGGPMTLLILKADGGHETVRLGQDLAAGQTLQHVVRAGSWFGGWPDEGTDFSLVGCTVAPGFEFADFELGDKRDLLARYPAARALIERCMGPSPSGR